MSSIFNLVEQVKAGAGRGSKVGLDDSPTQDGDALVGLGSQGTMLNLRKTRTKRSLGTAIQGGTSKDFKRQDTRTQNVRKGPRGSVCLSDLTLS